MRGLASAAARDSMQPGRGITQPKLILISLIPLLRSALKLSTPFPLKTPCPVCLSDARSPLPNSPEIMPPFWRENTIAVCQPDALSRRAFAPMFTFDKGGNRAAGRGEGRGRGARAPLKGFVPIEVEQRCHSQAASFNFSSAMLPGRPKFVQLSVPLFLFRLCV